MFGMSPFAASPFGALGTVDALVAVTGVQATGFIENVAAGAAYPVTSVVGHGQVGTVLVRAAANFDITGVQGTGEIGTARAASTVRVTGLSATGYVASVSIDADAIIIEDNVTGIGQIGTVLVRAKSGVSVQGVEGIGQTGQANVIAYGTIIEDGVAGLGQIGSVATSAAALVAVSGVEGTGETGTIRYASGVRPTGVSATASVGTPFIAVNKRVYPTGVSGRGALTSVLVWGQINDAQTPNWTEIPT